MYTCSICHHTWKYGKRHKCVDGEMVQNVSWSIHGCPLFDNPMLSKGYLDKLRADLIRKDYQELLRTAGLSGTPEAQDIDAIILEAIISAIANDRGMACQKIREIVEKTL